MVGGERRSVGGRALAPGEPRFVLQLKTTWFTDHNGSRALRVYNTWQDPTQDTLEPPFGWIFYILQPLSDSEITNTAIDVFSALTDDSNLQFWRFEFVTLSSSSEASDCAEHFRSEKEHRVGAGGLALPDYSATRAYQYTNTVLIIRDVASWKPSGIDVFQFDINPNHRIAKKGKSPGENLYEGMNVRDEPVPFGGEAPDASDYTDKFGITVEQTMDLAWESQERLRELTEGFKKAAKGGKTRW